MPKFAAVDHAGLVTNVLSASRLEDLTHAPTHGVGLDGDLSYAGDHESLLESPHRQVEGYGEPVLSPTTAHLDSHRASEFVEVTPETGPARVGMLYSGGEFKVGPTPLASASDQQIIEAATARGLARQPSPAN